MLQNPLKGHVRNQLVEEQGNYVLTICAESLSRMFRLVFFVQQKKMWDGAEAV